MAFVFAWHRIKSALMGNSDDIPTTDTIEINQLINRVKQGKRGQGGTQFIETAELSAHDHFSRPAKTHIDKANEKSPVGVNEKAQGKDKAKGTFLLNWVLPE